MRTTLKPFTLVALALLLGAVSVRAIVDDSHSLAMEAAAPYVEQGFIVREEYWSGEVKSGQTLVIKHQMFKGNEYAFWLGSADDGVKFDLKIHDDKGQELTMTGKSQEHFASARVNPPRTGTYTLSFTLSRPTAKSVNWALAYGYR
jgi:hypothetical protein